MGTVCSGILRGCLYYEVEIMDHEKRWRQLGSVAVEALCFECGEGVSGGQVRDIHLEGHRRGDPGSCGFTAHFCSGAGTLSYAHTLQSIIRLRRSGPGAIAKGTLVPEDLDFYMLLCSGLWGQRQEPPASVLLSQRCWWRWEERGQTTGLRITLWWPKPLSACTQHCGLLGGFSETLSCDFKDREPWALPTCLASVVCPGLQSHPRSFRCLPLRCPHCPGT